MGKAARAVRLTKRTVDAAAPQERRYILWDAELAGFGLRVEPTGRKTFVARYRAGGGRSGILRQETVGRYGTLTPDEARTNARKTLALAIAGGDPLGDRHAARQLGVTINQVCDWFLSEAESGRLLGRRGRPIKASTLATDRNRIDAHVRPLLGKRAVRTLAVRDIEQMQADIAARKTAVAVPNGRKRRPGGIPQGGSGTAGRTLGMLRTILEHAVRRGLIAENPARGAKKIADGRRTKRLGIDQIRLLGQALRDAEADGGSVGLAVIRLILLTGFRRSEALGIRREWLMPSGGIDFPDTKTGPQVRPIGGPATNLLKARFADPAQEWAFPAERGDGHFVGLPKVLARVSARARLSGLTAHVLRHTFASIAGELGFSELTIAGLLGHASGSVTAGYVHLDAALVSAANRVAAVIADALDGKAGANIVPLRVDAG